MSSDASKIYRHTSDASGRIEITPVLTRERIAREHALQEVIVKARTYTHAREACPVGDWQDRLEQAGWELAQAVRAYDKSE